jgi:hypothetical protein
MTRDEALMRLNDHLGREVTVGVRARGANVVIRGVLGHYTGPSPDRAPAIERHIEEFADTYSIGHVGMLDLPDLGGDRFLDDPAAGLLHVVLSEDSMLTIDFGDPDGEAGGEPEIVVLPDPGDIVFDERGTPILTYTDHHPEHGAGWVLYYLDDPSSPTAGVDEYFIGGDFADLDWATEQARAHLRRR